MIILEFDLLERKRCIINRKYLYHSILLFNFDEKIFKIIQWIPIFEYFKLYLFALPISKLIIINKLSCII
jgi:hypothetical protein